MAHEFYRNVLLNIDEKVLYSLFADDITVRDKKLIGSICVQNPNDSETAYRSKDGKKEKVCSMNITEACE